MLNFAESHLKTLQNNRTMTTKIFKTYKDMQTYLDTEYPELKTNKYSLDQTLVTERGDYEFIDCDYSPWCGEMTAYDVLDENRKRIDSVSCWEPDGLEYKIQVRGKVVATADNRYDARQEAEKALKSLDWDDDEEPECPVSIIFKNPSPMIGEEELEYPNF